MAQREPLVSAMLGELPLLLGGCQPAQRGRQPLCRQAARKAFGLARAHHWVVGVMPETHYKAFDLAFIESFNYELSCIH